MDPRGKHCFDGSIVYNDIVVVSSLYASRSRALGANCAIVGYAIGPAIRKNSIRVIAAVAGTIAIGLDGAIVRDLIRASSRKNAACVVLVRRDAS